MASLAGMAGVSRGGRRVHRHRWAQSPMAKHSGVQRPTNSPLVQTASGWSYPFQLMNGLDIPILANLLRHGNCGSPFIFEKMSRFESQERDKSVESRCDNRFWPTFLL